MKASAFCDSCGNPIEAEDKYRIFHALEEGVVLHKVVHASCVTQTNETANVDSPADDK